MVKRSSARNFDKNKRVSDEDVRRILTAGITAPSAGNIQPRTFIIVRDQSVKDACTNYVKIKSS